MFLGAKVSFTEYEVVQGEDDVEVPMNYVGTVDGNSISGNVHIHFILTVT
jgi:hypothetical protein